MKLNQQLALWADRLRDISAQGLLFCEISYDRERYHKVQEVAIEMMAVASGETPDQLEPLRGPVFTRPAPIPTADAAIIDEQGRILLIQRADNHKWAMPGGLCDVGETPAEAAHREALEESGVDCEVLSLIGVHDSRLCGSTTRHHLYHFLFLCRPIHNTELAPASHAHEVLGKGWFLEDALPNDVDPGHTVRIQAAYRVWHGQRDAEFDRLA